MTPEPWRLDRARLLQEIADLAGELCDPHRHAEVLRLPDKTAKPGSRRRRSHLWETTQPGLLAQLAEAIAAGSVGTEGGGGRFVPASKPPLCLEALSRYVVIEIGSARWCWDLDVAQRDTVEGNIRALVGASGVLDADTMAHLAGQLCRWHTWAAVMTGWQSPAYHPPVPCPQCGQAGSLRVSLARQTALCVAHVDDDAMACGARWDADSIGVLASYIAKATETVAAAPRPPPVPTAYPAAGRDLFEPPLCPGCGGDMSVSWQHCGTPETPDQWLPAVLWCGPCSRNRASHQGAASSEDRRGMSLRDSARLAPKALEQSWRTRV